MRTYDIAVIGAGVIGTSICRELSRYRVSVVLLEKEEELSFGVSKSNSGIIHPGTQNPPGSLKGKLCVEGNRLTRFLSEDLGADFKEVGELITAFSDDDVRRLEEIKKQAELLSVPGLELKDKDWLRRHEPNLSNDVVCALYAPTAGIISPYRWVYDLSENARANGVMVMAGCAVAGVEKKRDYFELSTSRGMVRARFAVNAAGLRADEVSALAGIRSFTIRPRKGQEFLLDKKRASMTNHLIFPLPSATSKGVIVIRTSDGNPMIGPTAEDIEDKDDFSTTEEGLRYVFDQARRMVPAVSESDIIAYFAGLRPVAGDDFIIRHEDAVPGFINVAGIQSPGLTASPAIAAMVCGILAKDCLPLRKKLFFRRYRRREAHLFSIPLSQTAGLIKKDKSYGDIVCRCEMVSAKEIEDAVARGARTMDGVKFRTRAQAGRCHGAFCTTRIMKILSAKTGIPLTKISKRGCGSELVKKDRRDERA